MASDGVVASTGGSGSRLHRAELVSSLGAGVLGVGLGLVLSRYLAGFAVPLLLIGIALHGWGMYDKRRLERGVVARTAWVEALYWLCWALLAGLVVVVAMAAI